jgi:hypothetical protein
MLEKKVFFGAMDSDSDDKLVESGDYRNARNLRNSIPDKAQVGSLPLVKGNTLVSTTLPGGQNKIIGHYDDVVNNRTFSFMWNENGAHKILLHSTSDGTRTSFISNTLLNFDPDFPVLHIDIVEDILLWTDNNNEPSSVLISKALTGFYDSVTSRQYFDAIAYAPNYAPTNVSYFSDTTYNQNNIRRKQFQFRYSYIDEMNRESAASAISKISVPSSEPVYFPSSEYDTYINNRIDFTIQTGIDFVKKINIYVREGNTGDWALAKTLNKTNLAISDNTSYTYNFYNDEAWTPVDQAYVNRLFDFVPLKSQCQSFLLNRRIDYTNFLEGFDNIVVDVEMVPQYNAIETIDSSLQAYINVVPPPITSGGPGLSVTATVNGPFPQIAKPGVGITPSNLNNDQIFTFSYTAIYGSNGISVITVKQTFSQSFPAGTTSLAICTYFAAQIQGNAAFNKSYTIAGGPGVISLATTAFASLISGSTYQVIVDTAFTATGALFPSPFVTKELQASLTVNQLKKTFKKAAHHKFAIVYYDNANRSGLCQVSDAMDVYVEPQSSNAALIGHVSMQMIINHEPPSWATHYQILYTGNNTKLNWLQFRVGTVTLSGDYYEVLLDTLVGYNDFYVDATELVYDFTVGDRFTVITDGSGNPSGTSGVYLTEYADVEIFSEGTNGGGDQFIKIPNTIAVAPEEGSLVEIYTPKVGISEQLYYEIGEIYPITNGFHVGNTQTQSSTQPAIIDFEGGDGYLRFRSGTFNSYVEDPSISDFYSSRVWDKGRPNRVDENERQIRRDTSSRYSEAYVPDTNLNGLSVIYDTSFVEGDIRYGSIQRTYSEDDRVESYYELKTSWRLVEKSIIYDAQGTPNITKSDEILSAESFYKGDYGIAKNPESFAVYQGQRYHTDANKGVVVRLTESGYDPIVDKMIRYFSDIFKTRVNFGAPFRVWGVFDIDHKEYVLCFEEAQRTVTVEETEVFVDGGIVSATDSIIGLGDTSGISQGVSSRTDIPEEPVENINNGTSSRSESVTYTLEPVTIAFAKEKNRWVEHYDWHPECVGSANIGVVSYKNGELYVHDTNETYNNFYGVQYDSEITFISNEDPSSKKVYQDIYTESTHAWSVEASNNKGQATSLETTDFEEIEGVFYAALLKDSNTPNVTDPIINGDDMRDYTMEITLRNNQTVESTLFAVNVRHVRSMLTNV